MTTLRTTLRVAERTVGKGWFCIFIVVYFQKDTHVTELRKPDET